MNITLNYMIIFVALLIIISYAMNVQVEEFNDTTYNDYTQDIRNMVSYIGPYVAQIYSYLNGQSANSMYIPTSPENDDILPIARGQIQSWIDSARKNMLDKYGQDTIDRYKSSWDLFYTIDKKGGLIITFVQFGDTLNYPV